jgi:hypothetical protein
VPDPASAGAASSAVTAAAQSLQQHGAGPTSDVLSAQQQRVLHGEWKRAAVALGSGISLQVGAGTTGGVPQ